MFNTRPPGHLKVEDLSCNLDSLLRSWRHFTSHPKGRAELKTEEAFWMRGQTPSRLQEHVQLPHFQTKSKKNSPFFLSAFSIRWLHRLTMQIGIPLQLLSRLFALWSQRCCWWKVTCVDKMLSFKRPAAIMTPSRSNGQWFSEFGPVSAVPMQSCNVTVNSLELCRVPSDEAEETICYKVPCWYTPWGSWR